MAKRSFKNSVLPTILTYLGLAIGLVFSAFPIVWMFFSSLKSNTEIFALPPRLFPQDFTVAAYLTIFNDPVKVRFFINSYFVAGVVTALTLVVAIVTAYGFSRYQFRFKNTLNIFIISTQTVPPITLLIPYFGMVVAFRIFDTYLALILTYMVFTLPYAILLMTGYLNTLPKELDEAVLVDGGSSWTALWRVIVPVSIPGIVATAVYTFLLAWNEFLFALTLTKSMNLRTVPIGIQLLMGQHAFEWNEMMAMSVLGSLPLLVLYLVAQRYFLAGMTAGSVKS
ncbi:carbohydrate ABC transporter permease [Rhizobium ruizarguesonis]|jgi:multiple sugar transport system permease protein|uniref:Carbohydrate ABC transporter permease n=1 Tax=Rhizobium ruizarguesonis TaxID=2081791 RepID=A0AB38HW32_9HYPH|nr:carbohydrate ABC transporter permease [Rhizobium ruizarguesonis]TCA36291.1 carbohydrate ABC transporter permease [Rhizobium leguminosarum bv. viciae]TAY86134.1 carbohydrate ABC transporter permease [Rhizobium ruizarguesonis]TBA34343.1 carbohydrate ABC transporter permease [Rhizobium ruizarguesonis]TBB60972.1 carbohydrate ABC transporter permease [Rhizobium ruizarguesonis]TBB84778.1 carbohydrate ABC transporter permease [Rhizobium ruizarguesonis]